MNDNPKEVFIRSDLNETSGYVAFFRLDTSTKEFIQLLLDKGNEIEAIELDLNHNDEPNRAGYNIGFAIRKVRDEKQAPKLAHQT